MAYLFLLHRFAFFGRTDELFFFLIVRKQLFCFEFFLDLLFILDGRCQFLLNYRFCVLMLDAVVGNWPNFHLGTSIYVCHLSTLDLSLKIWDLSFLDLGSPFIERRFLLFARSYGSLLAWRGCRSTDINPSCLWLSRQRFSVFLTGDVGNLPLLMVTEWPFGNFLTILCLHLADLASQHLDFFLKSGKVGLLFDYIAQLLHFGLTHWLCYGYRSFYWDFLTLTRCGVFLRIIWG
jgi:hypothetical protein